MGTLRMRACTMLMLALTAGLSVAGKSAPGTVAPASPLVAAPDLAGEPCTALVEANSRRDGTVPPPLRLRCGDSGTVVGQLGASLLPLETPAAGPARRAAIVAAARRSVAAAEIGRRMTCRAEQWLPMADGTELGLALCTLRDGNWPQLVLTYAQGRTLYQGSALPVLLPVLGRAIAVQSGKPFDLPKGIGDLPGLGRTLGGAIPLCTAKDYADYDAALHQARIFNSQNASADAEAAYRKALDIQIRVFGPESPGAGEVLTSLALEVSNQQRFEEAASLFRRADPIIERTPGDFYRARLIAYRALDAANQGHYDDALRLARAATALRRRAIDKSSDFSDDAGGLAAQAVSRGELLHSLMIEAQMLLRLDDLASAEADAAEALEIITRTDGLPPWWRPNVLAFMGDLNAREGRLAVAERQHLDALRYRQRLFGESGPTALSYLALGKIYGGEGEWAASFGAYHSAFDILEKERDTRSTITFNQIAPFLSVAADPTVKPTPETEAEMFRAIQLTGASVTDQTIERSANRLAADNPAIADLIGQSEAARRRLASLRIAYAEETDRPAELRDAKRETALATDIAAAEAALAEAGQHLQKSFPAVSDLSEPGPVTLGAFRARLDPGEGLVLLALGSKESWVMFVSRDRLIARPLKVTEDSVTTDVETLRRAFALRAGKVPRFDLAQAHALYSALLGPVDQQFAGLHRIVFVSHGPLASLPFSILVATPPKSGAAENYGQADWLVRHFAISQVPTVRAFVALREARQHHTTPKLPLLAFAAPSFAGPVAGTQTRAAAPANAVLATIEGQCREGGPMAPDLLRGLAPLPETATEATMVATSLGASPSAVHVGADASEAVLRAQALDQYGVLYFATHGLLPGELRCQSEPGLVLSPPLAMPVSKADDGLLESSEIASLRLNADLVVLSACNTAENGGRFGGDALSGLAEAFFYAGARGIIASHWEVPSRATVVLMTGMFERVKSLGTAEALRQSQMQLIDQPLTAHPFYWAAFTLIGDGLATSQKVAGR